MEAYVYILECSNGSLYTGYTHNLSQRYQAHISGRARCKYTRSFPPVRMVQSWGLTSKSAALQVEHKIKNLTKAYKLQLIANPQSLSIMLQLPELDFAIMGGM